MEVDRDSEGFSTRGGVVGSLESRLILADSFGSEFITALETGGRGFLIDRSSNHDSGEGKESRERDGEANQHSEERSAGRSAHL